MFGHIRRDGSASIGSARACRCNRRIYNREVNVYHEGLHPGSVTVPLIEHINLKNCVS